VAIIRFTFESIVVFLYRVGVDTSWWWDLSICDVLGGGGWSVTCAIWGQLYFSRCFLERVSGFCIPFCCLLLVGWCVLWRGENQRISADACYCVLVGDLCDKLWLSSKWRCVLTCVLSILCICGVVISVSGPLWVRVFVLHPLLFAFDWMFYCLFSVSDLKDLL